MAGGVDISFLEGQGVDDLVKAFGKLDEKEQKKITRKITRAGAKVMVPTIKSLTPVDYDRDRIGRNLVDTIKVKSLRGKRFSVGAWVRTGTKEELGIDADSNWYYPAHLEYGFTRSNGTQVPAQSYLRAGFDIKKGAALKVMAVGLFKELKKRFLAK